MQSIRAETIYTGAGVRRGAYLVFNNERIIGLAAHARGELVGKCAVLTPALVDAHSHIGIHRHGEPSAEGESNDHLDSILPLLDVLDSVQMDDRAFRAAIEWGVLYSCVLPGSANLIGGHSAVVRHAAAHNSEALIARAGLKAALGYNPMAARDRKGTRPSTRMGALAVLRGRLRELQTKLAKKTRKSSDAELSADDIVLRDVLRGRLRLRVHAHKTDDIATLLRLVDEFKLRVTVEHAMDVDRPEIFAELRKRGIPVIYGPVDTSASKVELVHKHWSNARHLIESGVVFGLMSDHPVTPAWSLLQQTRALLRCGLDKTRALETVTRVNAELLGIGDRVGTLAKGRWASFVCWNGDPFDLASHPTAVYGEGRRLYG